MTSKELIQAYRECQRQGSCKGCPGNNDSTQCAIEMFDADDVIDRLEALLAENERLRASKNLMQNTIDTLRRGIPRWISVSERLPKDGEDVLAYSDNEQESRYYPANYDCGIWWDCIRNEQNTNTTHWMPKIPCVPDGKRGADNED